MPQHPSRHNPTRSDPMNRTSQHQRPAADEWNKLVALPHPKSPKPPKPTPENKQPRTYTFSRIWKYTSRTAAVIAISVIFILALVYVWPNLIAQEPASSGQPRTTTKRLPDQPAYNPPTGHARTVSLSDRSTSNHKSNGGANNSDPLYSNPHSAQKCFGKTFTSRRSHRAETDTKERSKPIAGTLHEAPSKEDTEPPKN